MGEFGIAPKRLTARPDFANAESSRKRRAPDFNEGPIPGVPVLEQLLQNVRSVFYIVFCPHLLRKKRKTKLLLKAMMV